MRDIALSLVAYSLLLGYVLFGGDPIFIGIWYYLALIVGIWGLALLVRAGACFCTGSTLALAASLLVYMVANVTKTKPDGLMGLGHLFSMPGAYAGIMLAAILANRSKESQLGGMRWFVVGFLGFLAGFGANQAVVCNTLMYCGGMF